MTDQEKLVALLREWGVPFSARRLEYKNRTINEVKISADDQASPRIEGYFSFYTVFEFDGDGKFNLVGIWE